MRSIIKALLLAITFSLLSLAQGSITMLTVTRSAPSGCVQPRQAWVFSPNDSYVYFWAYVKGARKGESGRVAWTFADYPQVDEQLPAAQADGDLCITAKLPVAGAKAATQIGEWRVKPSWQGSLQDTVKFTILSEVQADTGLSIIQTSAAGCPVIKLLANMRDAKGNALSGLTSSNFVLKEDGQTLPMTVTEVRNDTLSVALVLDVSGSMYDALATEQAAAKQFLNQLPAGAQVAIYAIGITTALHQDFTSDRNLLSKRIDELPLGGGTPLWATILEAGTALRQRQGRKAIVTFTDGRDGDNPASAIQAAKDAFAPLYTVGFGDANQYDLAVVSAKTAGFHTAAGSLSDLVSIAANLGKTLAAFYEIGYTTANAAEQHNVEITVQAGGQTFPPVKTSVASCSSGPGPGPDPTNGVVLTAEKVTARPGDAVDVPITIKSTNAAPAAFQVDLTYDPQKLKFNSAAKGAQATDAGKDVTCTPVAGATGKLRLIGAGFNQNVLKDGTVALMNFTLQSSFAPNTSTPLGCSDPLSTDAAAKSLTTTCAPGSVTAASGCSCDLNANGNVDASDVQLMINQVLELEAARCDLNGDGQTDVADLQIVINAALGKGCAR